MGTGIEKRIMRAETIIDPLINWARSRSLWPMYFGLSCCFVETATTVTARYDLSRFGAEVLRASPRQADLLIIAGTVFKKVAPVVLRLYEQMAEPKWVVSMGSCANTGGMYDVYSVVQGINQILPVDVYIPGCPPRPEAVIQGITILQKKIEENERPTRAVYHLGGGIQGTTCDVLSEGHSKSRDPRGPGMEEIPIRGNPAIPPQFKDNRFEGMWTPPAHSIQLSESDKQIAKSLKEKFGDSVQEKESVSDMPTFIIKEHRKKEILRFLKYKASSKFLRLEDLTAIDESQKIHRDHSGDFAMVYHLLSFDPPSRLRIKVPIAGQEPITESIRDIWPSADWYEREVFDMFGIRFKDHPNMQRILMPHYWEGHPLRKNYPGRATEMDPYTAEDARKRQPLDAGFFVKKAAGDEELVLNIGPHHPATHGLMRFVVSLSGEEITDMNMDIGFHHRAVEKIGERQHWHQFIPYTDRVDYMAGAANNLPYVLSVEKVAGIAVPERAIFIRVLLSELFRLNNHLVFFGIFSHELGAMTPTFYTFREREILLDIVEKITGGRLHPSWLRIGGVAKDLPENWKDDIDALLNILPGRIDEYEKLITKNPIIRARSVGIGKMTPEEAIDWGVTGPNLRATGIDWDLRKKMPYSGYENFDFDVPVGSDGDCYTRYLLRVEEMRQSIRIIKQVIENMPEGRYITDDYRYVIPPRQDMLKDIESLIHHFIHVTRGPKIPPGEAYVACEIPRGEQGYYIVSDGKGYAYRMRIRGPGFANVQILPKIAKGLSISDFIAFIASVDYTLPDIDR